MAKIIIFLSGFFLAWLFLDSCSELRMLMKIRHIAKERYIGKEDQE